MLDIRCTQCHEVFAATFIELSLIIIFFGFWWFFGIHRNFQSISAICNFSRFCIIYLAGIRHNFRPIFATRYHLCYLLIFLALFCPIYLHVPHSPVIINIYQQIYFFKAFLSPLAFVTYLHLTILLLFAQLFVLRICPLFPYCHF